MDGLWGFTSDILDTFSCLGYTAVFTRKTTLTDCYVLPWWSYPFLNVENKKLWKLQAEKGDKTLQKERLSPALAGLHWFPDWLKSLLLQIHYSNYLKDQISSFPWMTVQRTPVLRVIYFRSTKAHNIQLFCQFLKGVEVTDCSCSDPVVILPKSMDMFL